MDDYLTVWWGSFGSEDLEELIKFNKTREPAVKISLWDYVSGHPRAKEFIQHLIDSAKMPNQTVRRYLSGIVDIIQAVLTKEEKSRKSHPAGGQDRFTVKTHVFTLHEIIGDQLHIRIRNLEINGPIVMHISGILADGNADIRLLNIPPDVTVSYGFNKPTAHQPLRLMKLHGHNDFNIRHPHLKSFVRAAVRLNEQG